MGGWKTKKFLVLVCVIILSSLADAFIITENFTSPLKDETIFNWSRSNAYYDLFYHRATLGLLPIPGLAHTDILANYSFEFDEPVTNEGWQNNYPGANNLNIYTSTEHSLLGNRSLKAENIVFQHTFPQFLSIDGRLSCAYWYDDLGTSPTWSMVGFDRVSSNTQGLYMGYFRPCSQDSYCYYKPVIGATATNVPRSAGWHEFCMNGTKVDGFISFNWDSKNVFQYQNPPNYDLISLWSNGVVAYMDDVRLSSGFDDNKSTLNCNNYFLNDSYNAVSMKALTNPNLGSIDFNISNDNGNTWRSISSNQSVLFPQYSNSFTCTIKLRQGIDRNSTPQLYDLAFNLTSIITFNTTLPDLVWEEDTNVTLDISQYITIPTNQSLGFSVSGTQFVNAIINNNTGIVVFYPPFNFYGIDHASIQISDETGYLSTSNQFLLNVTPVNDPPQFSPFPSITLSADTGFNQNILSLYSFVSDIDNNLTELNIFIVSQSGPQIVDCSIDAQNNLDCSVMPFVHGGSVVTLSASDGELMSFANLSVDVALQLTQCNQTIVQSGTYTLLNNVNSSGTCFTVQNSNIVLDCGGKSISYAKTAVGFGVTATSQFNVTIQQCTISNGGTFNNSFGIYLDDISGSAILQNLITTNASSSDAIHMLSSIGNTFMDNKINTKGTASMGIRLSFHAAYNYIAQNNISTSGSNAPGIGFVFSIFSDNNTIDSNAINSTSSVGISLISSNNNTIQGNNVKSTSNNALQFRQSSGNVVSSNVLGIVLVNQSNQNSFDKNTFEDIIYLGGDNNLFVNNTVSSCLSAFDIISLSIMGNTLQCMSLTNSTSGDILSNVFNGTAGELAKVVSSTNVSINNNLFTRPSGAGAALTLVNSSNSYITANTFMPVFAAAIRFNSSNQIVITHNKVISGGIPFWSTNSFQNTFVNNLFNTSNSTVFFSNLGNQTNLWNQPSTLQTNIVGAPQMGGNYYAQFDGQGYSEMCDNFDGDSFCDQPFALAPNNTDQLPLVDPKPRLTVLEPPILGTTIHFTISDLLHPTSGYGLAFSTMTSPPFIFGSHVIPLTPNSVFYLSLSNPEQIFLFNSTGITDPLGRATAVWTIPYIPSLNGLPLYFAFVIVNASDIQTVSSATEIILTQ